MCIHKQKCYNVSECLMFVLCIVGFSLRYTNDMHGFQKKEVKPYELAYYLNDSMYLYTKNQNVKLPAHRFC